METSGSRDQMVKYNAFGNNVVNFTKLAEVKNKDGG